MRLEQQQEALELKDELLAVIADHDVPGQTVIDALAFTIVEFVKSRWQGVNREGMLAYAIERLESVRL